MGLPSYTGKAYTAFPAKTETPASITLAATSWISSLKSRYTGIPRRKTVPSFIFFFRSRWWLRRLLLFPLQFWQAKSPVICKLFCNGCRKHYNPARFKTYCRQALHNNYKIRFELYYTLHEYFVNPLRKQFSCTRSLIPILFCWLLSLFSSRHALTIFIFILTFILLSSVFFIG